MDEMMDREQAIDRSIELWEDLKKTGEEDKSKWKGWEKYGHAFLDCFLCEYGLNRFRPHCEYCPWEQAYGRCYKTTSPYQKWENAVKIETRKKYAGQCVDWLKKLKEKL